MIRPTPSLLHSNRRLEALARQLRDGWDTERCATMRDLHEEIGQILSVITLNLQEFGRQPNCPDAKSAEEELAHSFQILDQVLQSARNLTLSLKTRRDW